MTKKEAISCLADGHSLWTVEYAKEICKALGVKFNNKLIFRWKGQKDANPNNEPKGLWLNEDKPGEGVAAESLSDYVAYELLGRYPSGDYIGRGFGAQANAREVAKHLGL